MFRPLVFVIAVAESACAMAGVADNNSNLDGSSQTDAAVQMDAPDHGSGSGSGSGPGSGSGTGSGSGSGSNTPPGNCSAPATGTIATWDVSSGSGGQTSDPGTTPSGATAGDLTRSLDLVATSGAGSINSNNWSTLSSMPSSSSYYTMTITPPSGCTVTITGASITTKASSTGPSKSAIATSADGYSNASTITVSTTDTTSTPSLSVSGASGTITLRVFGWDASSSNGTYRIEDQLTLTGSFQ